MDRELLKKKILEFLGQHSLCVISTIHIGGKSPESAVVAFAEMDNLELIFGTSNTSRKYKNIQENHNVSLVIGWNSKIGTIQYEGIARELSKDGSPKYAAIQVRKNPESSEFVNREDQRYFIVSPIWIRFVDNAGDSPDTYEINF